MIISKVRKAAARSVALALAASFAVSTALPVATATAGERDWRGHGGSHDRHYDGSRYRYDRKGRRYVRNNNGDWVLAGLLGLAVGAIIADQSNRDREERVYVYEDDPYPAYGSRREYPSPRDSAYDERFSDDYDYDTYGSVQRRPLASVPPPARLGNSSPASGGDAPRVIRYEDEMKLTYEPWTPEWRDWCDAKYRSFKASTGTYRGYDGKDHFCVVR